MLRSLVAASSSWILPTAQSPKRDNDAGYSIFRIHDLAQPDCGLDHSTQSTLFYLRCTRWRATRQSNILLSLQLAMLMVSLFRDGHLNLS
jgi:hypothetical protein